MRITGRHTSRSNYLTTCPKPGVPVKPKKQQKRRAFASNQWFSGEWWICFYRAGEAPAEPKPSSAGASLSHLKTRQVDFNLPLAKGGQPLQGAKLCRLLLRKSALARSTFAERKATIKKPRLFQTVAFENVSIGISFTGICPNGRTGPRYGSYSPIRCRTTIPPSPTCPCHLGLG